METLLARAYKHFIRIDCGGQGNVYKTFKNEKPYAIKVVPIEARYEGGGVPAKLDDDLKRELQICRGLRHPNCIHVEDLFRTRSRVYIVMDFMPNGTVATVVRKSGPLCEWNVKIWFPAILQAVAYLHAHKVAHRDLKLDNILLDAHFNPIVSDYGFSRYVTFTQSGAVVKSDTYCGTMSHNPPEILKHIPYDPFLGDIWCLGVMLFIMVNQLYPFDRHEGKERMYERQLARDYRLQADIELKSSVELKSLIHLLLEPVEKKRPTIGQLLEHPWVPLIHRESKCITE